MCIRDSFLYNATNTNEVYAGTDAPLIAGNLRLTTNTGSTSSTTGTLVVTGGVGISENLNVDGTTTFNDDVLVNKNFILRDDGSIGGANGYDFKIQNQYGSDKFTVDSVLGATTIGWSLDVDHDTSIVATCWSLVLTTCSKSEMVATSTDLLLTLIMVILKSVVLVSVAH